MRWTSTASARRRWKAAAPTCCCNLLEVRGIGLLDIKAIFGETAVRRKMRLKLIVHLVRKETMEREFERLPYEPLYEDILGMPVRKVVIAVDAGRNLAVLVEAAVRNTILQLRGIDTYQEFIARHQRAMEQGDGRDVSPGPYFAEPLRGAGSLPWCSGVQRQRVLLQIKAALQGHRALALTRSRVEELLDMTAVRHTRWSWCWPSLSSNTALPLSKCCATAAGLLKLHQHAVHRGQADVGPFGQQALNTSSAVMWRSWARWNTSRILMRGSVAFRPAALEFFGVGHGELGADDGLARMKR
jgi:hypothetical protein